MRRNLNAVLFGTGAALLLFGVWLRIEGISSRSLEYDEIWTLSHYVESSVQAIFSDLATPNNHPLSSLAGKISCYVFGSSVFALRAPALLAGLLTPLLAALFAWRLLKDRMATLFVLAVCLFNGALIHYSQTARGYSMQTFFVLLAGFGLFGVSGAWRGPLFLLGALGSILSVPSGVVFIGPLLLAWIVLTLLETSDDGPGKKNLASLVSKMKSIKFRELIGKNADVLISFAVFGICAFLWYGLNYAKFKEGQSFGEDVRDPSGLALFAFKRLDELSSWLWILLLVALTEKASRRVGIICFSLVALALLSALFVKAGPARVYIPLIPFIALGAASAPLSKLNGKWRAIAFGALIFVSALMADINLAKWTPPDWKAVYPRITAKTPEDAYLVFRSGDGYPILNNIGATAVMEDFKRLEKPPRSLALVASSGEIDALSLNEVENKKVALPRSALLGKTRIEGVEVENYALKPLSATEKAADGIVFAVFRPDACQKVYEKLRKLKSLGQWGNMNCWLKCPLQASNGDRVMAFMLVAQPCRIPAKTLLDFAAGSEDSVEFMVFDETAAKGSASKGGKTAR